jgi:hypothetical protein
MLSIEDLAPVSSLSPVEKFTLVRGISNGGLGPLRSPSQNNLSPHTPVSIGKPSPRVGSPMFSRMPSKQLMRPLPPRQWLYRSNTIRPPPNNTFYCRNVKALKEHKVKCQAGGVPIWVHMPALDDALDAFHRISKTKDLSNHPVFKQKRGEKVATPKTRAQVVEKDVGVSGIFKSNEEKGLNEDDFVLTESQVDEIIDERIKFRCSNSGTCV